MPQKRNPVALEHARALTSKAIGQAAAIGLAVHNTPFGDIVVTEDDLQPLVAAMFRDAVRSVRLTAAAVGAIELDVLRLQRGAAHGGTTLTELADDLVRVHGVAPRAAQTLARRLHEVRAADATVSPADALARLSGELLGRVITDTDDRLTAVMSPEHFIAVRVTRGGPAPTETGRALEHARSRLVEHRAWLADMRSALGQAERRLAARSAAL
jgi:argininosuccinate lyase